MKKKIIIKPKRKIQFIVNFPDVVTEGGPTTMPLIEYSTITKSPTLPNTIQDFFL